MRINEKNFEHFHMLVNAFSFQPMQASIALFQPEKSMYPLLGNITMSPKTMQFVAEFRSKMDISNFISELLHHKENLIDIEDGFLYHCYYLGENALTEYWNGWYRLSVTFLVMQTGHLMKQPLHAGENRIHVNGNWECECQYEITPRTTQDQILVNGITIHHVSADTTIYLDGIAKKVYTASNPNKYGDCTFPNQRFPTLKPGLNTIHVTGDVQVLLKYYPMYV